MLWIYKFQSHVLDVEWILWINRSRTDVDNQRKRDFVLVLKGKFPLTSNTLNYQGSHVNVLRGKRQWWFNDFNCWLNDFLLTASRQYCDGYVELADNFRLELYVYFSVFITSQLELAWVHLQVIVCLNLYDYWCFQEIF